MKKLDAMIKQSIVDRKSDEKVNKVTRQEVTAMAAEMKTVKKRTGKLAKSVDTAQGDIKRTSEGLDALNKTLIVAGPSTGAAGPGLATAVQASAANGIMQPGFFSGQPQKAAWVKSMVVRVRALRGCISFPSGTVRHWALHARGGNGVSGRSL